MAGKKKRSETRAPDVAAAHPQVRGSPEFVAMMADVMPVLPLAATDTADAQPSVSEPSMPAASASTPRGGAAKPKSSRRRQAAAEPKRIEIKRIDPKEFLEAGYLQELNRQFLHPLGLALEVFVEPDGTVLLGGVQDYREEPEGLVFEAAILDSDEGRAKAARVAEERAIKTAARTKKFGWEVQPIPQPPGARRPGRRAGGPRPTGRARLTRPGTRSPCP